MSKAEALQKQLDEFRVDSESEDSIFLPKFKRLPKELHGPAFALLNRDERGKQLPNRWSDELAWEKASKKLLLSNAKLDKLPAAKRTKIFACFAPKIASTIEKAWQHLKTTPYQVGYSSRAFRAVKDPSVTLPGRIDWLTSLINCFDGYDTNLITVPWLAQWTPHAFQYRSDTIAPILTVAINQRTKAGDEVYEILHQSVTREHPIGMMGEHVIESLLGSNREEGWDLMEKTLLAAQRQEGLRQSIVQATYKAHPDAFERMLKLILEKNLIRFSSVVRSVNLWFGLLWDSVSTKVISEYVESVLTFIQSATERKKGLASSDAETVYRALWASAFHDAPSTIPLASKLLKHSSDEVRFVAAWMLTRMGLDASRKAKLPLIEDENLQIALLAAVNTRGISMSEDAEMEFDDEDVETEQIDKRTFVRLEELYARMPEKPKKLPAIVWPWTERKADRGDVAGCLLSELGDRPPTDMLPYLKGLDSYQQSEVISLLSRQKKWDALTRSTLFELAGHASSDVRKAAFDALKTQIPTIDERHVLEGYLSRISADLRLNVVSFLMKGNSNDVLESADRLLNDGNRNRRLAGLEITRQLAEAAQKEISSSESKTPKSTPVKKKTTRSAKKKTAGISGAEMLAACQKRGLEYQESRKKLTTDEQVQLDAIAASDRETYSMDNGLGLVNPDRRSEIVPPQKKKLLLISKAAIECLKSIDDLIHKNRKEIVETDSWRGKEETPLGEVEKYDLPTLDFKKPLKAQKAKFPLMATWDEWKAKRPAKLKDKDGLELLRAMMASDLFEDDYDYQDVAIFAKKPDQKKIAIAVLGELTPPKLRYGSLVCGIVEQLLLLEIPRGTVDFLLDASENSYAHVTDEMHQRLLTHDDEDDDYDYDRNSEDWRRNEVFRRWFSCFGKICGRTGIKLTKQQEKRNWQLMRFHDEPIEGASRDRMSLHFVCESFQCGFAKFDDIADVLIGPGRGRYSAFGELSSISRNSLEKEVRELLSKTKGLADWLDQARERLLEIELERGEAPTAATPAALAMSSFRGIDVLIRVMSKLGKEKLKVLRGWNASTDDSRSATLTELISNIYPAENDTPEEFKKQIRQAIKDGYCDETKLLELAFLAPQWTKFVEAYLNWDGFSEGLYWFLAHMSSWGDSAQQAAAAAEGLDDDEDFDEDEMEDEFDEDDEQSQSIKKPRKLSAWERLVLERTPLTDEERSEGAVDVDWFHRTWEQLGAKRWQGLADAAKFSANSAQAKKAQFLADVLLGNAKKKDLVDGIKNRNLKDNVRLLGLLPLEKGTKRDKDVMDRYTVLQAYKKYARGLSGLTKPDAFRALDIGFANLARIAGYRDPLRLEWALEAESVKDLAKGPVSVTKEGLTVTLSLDESAKPQLIVRRGDKPLKTIPAAAKKKHAAIQELAERGKELRTKSSRMKQSLEAAMCRGDIITGSELLQLMQHAILSPQLSRLVLVGEGIMGYPDKGGKALRDFAGKLEPVKKNESLRIAHPSDLLASKKWDRWQRDCFQAERVQPFKQIFRELYVVTSQEKKDGGESSRFAGQQIGPRQAMALWNSRGWNTRDEVFKMFHELSLVAEVNFQWDYGTAAEVEGLTLETIRFRSRDDFKPMKLAKVPPNVFSEVMRDIDLVVSVAHRGEVDPEASASTVEMRSMLVNETCKLLGLKNVQLKKSHAFIKGHYAEYSLHLGSGNVQRIPGGALAILPVHAQHRGRLFLPFADDDPRTAEVISKVLLLARDEEIQDPMILDQLAVPMNVRKSIAITDSDEGAKSAAPNRRGKKKTTTASASAASAASKQRYELNDGKSSKFWEVAISGNDVTTTWGRIGTNGQTKTKSFESSNDAQAEYDRLVREKTQKGYEEA